MSRSAHARSTYQLRKLPMCSRCNSEFNLVFVVYDTQGEVVQEWECPKCHKTVPKNLLNEEDAQKVVANPLKAMKNSGDKKQYKGYKK